MFSATFPRQMEALARRILQKPIEVQVGGRSVVCKEVEQHVVIIEEDNKFLKLLELLGIYQEMGSIIVFVDKQENADILLKELMKAAYNCLSLHGGIDQFDRDSTIIDFKSGKVKLLIATSVAARGLDVKQLILVINYDCPNHYEDYVHRCGRTGRAGNKGFAYTFVTPEQCRYAGDLIKAFELATLPVPDDLRSLWETYKSKQEAEGKKVHSGGGFSGKGFKFDESEAAAVNEKKKFQKAALGLADSDDEDLEHDIDQQIETCLINSSSLNSNTAVDKLELAKRLASKINLTKSSIMDTKFATQQAAESILKGSGSQPPITAKTVAEQLAAKLNTKLNYQPKDDDDRMDEDSEQTFRKYEEELEINDFPQQARWRVTSKEALAQISEYSEAGITVRGTYVPTGKAPPEGERKLYLAIESTSDIAVSKAKAEITRLIKEELLKLQTAGHHTFNKASHYSRKILRGGGCAIWARKDLIVEPVNVIKHCIEQDFEVCGVKWSFNQKLHILICIYRAPTGNFQTFADGLEAVLNSVFTRDALLWIAGDFNINFNIPSFEANEILNIMAQFGLHEVVFENTRVTSTTSTRIDNVFINVDNEVVTSIDDTPISDHKSITVKVKRLQIPLFVQETNMKISQVLLAGFCIIAVTSGHPNIDGHAGVDVDLHIPGFGVGAHANFELGHEKYHGVEVNDGMKVHHGVPEHVSKMYLKKADKTLLQKQKQILTLLYQLHQESLLPEHIKIAGSFSPFHNHDLYLKDGVVENFHEYWKYASLTRSAIFSIHDQLHMEQAVALIEMFFHAENFDVFYKTAVWARMNVNEGMFVYCLYVTVVHRADTKEIMLPPIYEVTPHLFFGADVINKAQYYKQVHETHQHDMGKGYNGYTIYSNYSNQHMNLDHEQTSLAYYLQDVGLNAFYYNLHIHFPFWMNGTEFKWSKLPRGDFHYLVSRSLWARYNLERVPYGYADMEYLDWDLPVETSYHSNLVYPNGMPFPNRPKFAKLHEYFYNYGQSNWAKSIDAYSHTLVKDFERRMANAIEKGAIWNEAEGQLVKIDSHEFLNVLGNLIEGNHDSPNFHYYGPIWHYARHLLGYSTQQLDQNEVLPSALEHFETTMRDPVFYRLIMKLVVLPFQRYLSRIPAYTKDELTFNGVEVTEVEMGPLHTYYDSFYSSLVNSVFYKPHEPHGDFNVRVRQLRLNHLPFEFKIHIKSEKPQKASVKVFMGPKYDRNGKPMNIKDNRLYFVQMEHFVTDLHAGDNVITRKSTDNILYSPDKVSYVDLWKNTVAALENNEEFTTDLRQNWYGFPMRFMIPKGSVGGTPYQMFVAVYPHIEPHTQHSHNLGVLQMDNHPFSYPLDRFIKFDRMWDYIPNFHFEEVKVYFKEILGER
ncbi:hypothetical protein JTB14_026954 [Gonioctena quinquepunctata]|nr:hypothetical protein JTB14_026954 [Gonioctena quinquepunctata]